MYIAAILLICTIGVVAGPVTAVDAFGENRIALGIMHIIIALLFLTVAILIFKIRERCGDFELDAYVDEDDPITRDLKDIGGYAFGFAIVLTVIVWFCCLAGIV